MTKHTYGMLEKKTGSVFHWMLHCAVSSFGAPPYGVWLYSEQITIYNFQKPPFSAQIIWTYSRQITAPYRKSSNNIGIQGLNHTAIKTILRLTLFKLWCSVICGTSFRRSSSCNLCPYGSFQKVLLNPEDVVASYRGCHSWAKKSNGCSIEIWGSRKPHKECNELCFWQYLATYR